jgi:hypothetical protein
MPGDTVTENGTNYIDLAANKRGIRVAEWAHMPHAGNADAAGADP